jgi:two-component system, cell cycle response regulator
MSDCDNTTVMRQILQPGTDCDDPTVTRQILQPCRCRVLVVDDDELVRARLAALLRLGGYEVLTAGSGEEALRVLNTTDCQIVLTDWQMPRMDGLELCRAVRLRDSKSYVYVLMLTVRNGTRDTLMGLAAGADDYLVKGASAPEILARVKVAQRITRLEHSLRTLNRENRRLSVTDPLTGAYNRRYLMRYLPREVERARRYRRPLAVLSCDLDRFKGINDGFGHEAGDQVLQSFFTRAAGCIREATDWIARTGGEEFVLVLPETSLHGANCVAKKLCHLLASQPILTDAGPLAVTVSIGVTAAETPQELASVSALELLRAADHYLYVSKRLGRGRATAAPASSIRTATPTAPTGARNEIN